MALPSPPDPYEFIEHTADIGIKAFGRSREELFANAARGMFALITPPEGVLPAQTVEIVAQSEDPDLLLVAWLKELLYRFDTEGFVGKEFEVRFPDPGRVKAAVSGEALDPARHALEREVKAVTYCDLSVGRDAGGTWTAQVIFDI